MKVAVGARTDVGRVREGNEDAYLAESPLFVVADGMGGHVAGDVASSTAIETILDHAGEADPSRPDSLAVIVRSANRAIWNRAQEDASLRGMGTTCTLVFVDGDNAHVAHVGDSRAYLFRAGELAQLTQDHTLVERMVQEGRLSSEEAQFHPQRNVITRVLGGDENVDVDVKTLDLEDGDRILICSDGLTGMVGEDSIRDLLAGEDEPQAAADRLIDLANEGGGEDNITAVILDFSPGRAEGLPARGSGDSTGPIGRAAGAGPGAHERGTDDGTATALRGTGSAGPHEERDAPHATAAAARPDTIMRPAPQREDEEDEVGPSRPRWRRKLMVALLGLGIIVVAAYFLVSYLVDNSFYVGLNGDRAVTIYRGYPEDIAGFSFSEVERTTELQLSDLPESYRDDLQEGIRAETLDDAENTVANLQRQARALREESGAKPKRDGDRKSQ